MLAKRLSIAALVALVAVVIALPMTASASGGPFVDKKIDKIPRPDSIPGLGTATADADADMATGLVSAHTWTAEKSPIGFSGSPIGTSQSDASGRLVQYLDVAAPGKYKVTATISDLVASATTTSIGIPSFSASASSVSAVARIAFVVCDATGACTMVPGGGTAFVSQPVACSAGCTRPSSVPLTAEIDAPQAGKIYVEPGLYASSYTQGLGSARADGTGNVTDVSATPVGEAPPPPPPQPGNTRVLVDTVTVDSRGAAETSHLALDAGKFYLLEPQGLYSYTGGATADAECANAPGDATYQPDRFGADLLDLLVDGSAVTWNPASGSANADEPECSDTHTYERVVTGAGNTVTFDLKDPDKADDLGALTVKIYLLP